MPLQSAGRLIAHPSDILSLISTFSQDQFILSIYALPNTLNLSKALHLLSRGLLGNHQKNWLCSDG
jgi:hypothetical protein